MKAALALAFACAMSLVAAVAAAQPANDSGARVFGVVRFGPIGQTVVQTPTRELDGSPVAAPGLGLRVDQPVRPNLLIGLDFGLLFEGENMLQPYAATPEGDELQLDGLVLDAVFSVRPIWPLYDGHIELFASGGVGLSWRPDVSGYLPLTDEHGATMVDDVWSLSGWGVLAQLGTGATFWLSDTVCVMFEATLIARRVNLFGEARAHGDFALVVDEMHGTLLTGAGAAWSGP